MARDNSVLESEDKFDLTSMIDVVFLLLIYFMYLPLQQEADLLFSLPAMTAPQENVALPSEQIVDSGIQRIGIHSGKIESKRR